MAPSPSPPPKQDGCMYMFGGVKDFAENTRTARITKVWLGVARLWDMCLEALRHYRHKLPPLPPAACEGNRVAVHSKLQSLLSHTQGEEDVALRRRLQHSDENEEVRGTTSLNESFMPQLCEYYSK